MTKIVYDITPSDVQIDFGTKQWSITDMCSNCILRIDRQFRHY